MTSYRKLYLAGLHHPERWSVTIGAAPGCGNATACFVASFAGRRGAVLARPNLRLPGGQRARYRPDPVRCLLRPGDALVPPSRRALRLAAQGAAARRCEGARATRRRGHRRASRPLSEVAATAARRLEAMETSLPVAERPRRPEWMKVRAPSADGRYYDVRKLLHGASLVTVCEEARCPNIGECWGRGTATFQILGDTCTRACRYCYVHSGKPEAPPDPLEPLRLAQAAATMGLTHVVVTSVDRDDLARPRRRATSRRRSARSRRSCPSRRSRC